MTQLLAMASESDQRITVFINSQGGHVEAGDTINDVVRFITPPVRMVGTGWVASAGALIFVSVPRKLRYCLPNTRFLLHQPAGGMGGTASDIAIEAREIVKMRERLNRIFARETGQSIERIEDDTLRNFWLDAEQAKEYGLVGKIIGKQSELECAFLRCRGDVCSLSTDLSRRALRLADRPSAGAPPGVGLRLRQRPG